MNFINPYNFVSLAGACGRPEPEQSAEAYTGVMECTLETLTPLFIPRNAYPSDIEFFSYDHESASPRPVIPGSSIRGVVRSVYEALTNGCLSTVDDEDVLYKRTSEPKGECGVLHKSELKIYPARRYGLPLRDGDKTGDFVTRGHPATEAPLTGYVLIGEKGVGGPAARKYKDSLFVEKTGEAPIKITPGDYERLVAVWRLYQTKKNNGVNEGNGNYRGYLAQEHIPVFYTKVDEIWYLSPACITKEVFTHTMKGILKAQGGYQPCGSRSGYCEACRLFGTVDGENQDAIASRVMFRDALPVSEEGWYDKPRSILLGGPKVTATEFYMEDAGGKYFTYDYRVNSYSKVPRKDKDGNLLRDESGRVISDTVYDKETIQPKLRGRKFYWHSKTQWEASKDTNAKKFRPITIRPVRGGKRFTFSIGFDRVTRDELARLKFALTLAFDEKNEYAHKLGHGKPVGYGSVKITVDAISAYEVDAELKLTSVGLPNLAWTPESTLPIREMQKMLNWTQQPANVHYPSVGANSKSYEWFAQNKKTEERSFTRPNYSFILPYPLSVSLALPETFRERQGNRANIAREKQNNFPGVRTAAAQPTAQPPASRPQVEKTQRKCVDCGKLHWTTFQGKDNRVRCPQCFKK